MSILKTIVHLALWVVICSAATLLIQLKQPVVGPIMEVATNIVGILMIGIGWERLLSHEVRKD